MTQKHHTQGPSRNDQRRFEERQASKNMNTKLKDAKEARTVISSANPSDEDRIAKWGIRRCEPHKKEGEASEIRK